MAAAPEISQGYQLVKMIHTFISGVFLISAVWLYVRSFRGYFQGRKYTKTDKVLSYVFIINLYLQLIFGLLLFSNPGSVFGYDLSGQDVSMEMASKRFWPIEHIVLMIFALFIANLGLIFTNNSQQCSEKFRKTLIYYSISIVLIALSLSSTYLF